MHNTFQKSTASTESLYQMFVQRERYRRRRISTLLLLSLLFFFTTAATCLLFWFSRMAPSTNFAESSTISAICAVFCLASSLSHLACAVSCLASVVVRLDAANSNALCSEKIVCPVKSKNFYAFLGGSLV